MNLTLLYTNTSSRVIASSSNLDSSIVVVQCFAFDDSLVQNNNITALVSYQFLIPRNARTDSQSAQNSMWVHLFLLILQQLKVICGILRNIFPFFTDFFSFCSLTCFRYKTLTTSWRFLWKMCWSLSFGTADWWVWILLLINEMLI